MNLHWTYRQISALERYAKTEDLPNMTLYAKTEDIPDVPTIPTDLVNESSLTTALQVFIQSMIHIS